MINSYKLSGRIDLVIVASLALVSVLLFTIFSFPTIRLPESGGDFAVGTTHYVLVDPPREEQYGERIGMQRKITIRIWYPAIDFPMLGKSPLFLGGDYAAIGIANLMNLDFSLLKNTVKSHGNSIPDAPVIENYRYPVIIISHTLKSTSSYYTDIAEYLAGRGYVVVGIDHTYAAAVTYFNDREVAYWTPEILTEPHEISGKLLFSTYRNDILIALKTLESFENGFIPSPFIGLLDLDKIGIIGHGIGGGAAINLIFDDYRIKAFVGLDPWLEWLPFGMIKAGLRVPNLLLVSEEWSKKPDYLMIKTLYAQSIEEKDFFRIIGTRHFDFTLLGRISPVTKLLGYNGLILQSRIDNIKKDFIFTFFEKQLRGNEFISLKELDEKYYEVHEFR